MNIKKLKIYKKLQNPKFLIKTILIFVIVVAFFVLFVFNNIKFLGVKSVNQGAKRYKTKTCLVFYPNSKEAKNYAKNLCKDAPDNSIYDYSLVPSGDYYLVKYGNEKSYYVEKETLKTITIDSLPEECKSKISDYLRYEMKKSEIDEAYTLTFLEATMPENINYEDVEYSIQDDTLAVYFKAYNYAAHVPLKYLQKELNINLGYEGDYVKPVYVSPRRKICAFTFDDGPNVKVSPKIVEFFHSYDSNATFFIQGRYLESDTMKIVKESINLGNQYGSHTQSHANLTTLSDSQIYEEIIGPANDFINGYHVGGQYDFDGIDYQMNIYRAPYGIHDERVDNASPFISIEWDVDSNDWNIRDGDLIAGEVLNYESVKTLEGKIVLFHDTVDETYDAMKILIPKIIKKGYQFVTVEEILKYQGISYDEKYYPW